MKTWLSIDFDYFVRSLAMWDWGHQEAPIFRAGFIWTTRAGPFLAQGVDLRDETDPDQYADPKPENFFDDLEQLGYDFSRVDHLFVEDSHAAAGPLFQELAVRWGAADLVESYDAHHDLGYCEWSHLMHLTESGRCMCDTWLCSLLCWCPDLEARIVFPDWLKKDIQLSAQMRSVKKMLPRSLLDRVKMNWFTNRAGNVNDVVNVPGETRDVDAVFICRSAAWVPPWLDETFVDFVESAEDATGLHATSPFAERGDDIDPLEPRADFSWEAVEQFAEMQKGMLAKMQRRREG